MRQALREARLRAKLTQAEVARSVGIDRTSYVHIERNNRNPSLGVAIKIADLLNVKIDVFLNDHVP